MFFPVAIKPLGALLIVTMIVTAAGLASGLTALAVRKRSSFLMTLAVCSPFINGVIWTMLLVLLRGELPSGTLGADERLMAFGFLSSVYGCIGFIPAGLAFVITLIISGKNRKSSP